MAGDVLTTATAGAEGAARIGETADSAQLRTGRAATEIGPGDGDRAAGRHAREPPGAGTPASETRHPAGRAGAAPAPGRPGRQRTDARHASGSPDSSGARARGAARLAGRRRTPPPGEARSTAGVRCEPCTRTADQDHPRAPPEGGRAHGGACLRVAAHWHKDQKRKSGDPYITHPLAVATILAELGMNTETICAALLHDTVEDTDYTLDRAAQRVRRGRRGARRRRHQAGQGQVRRLRRGRDRPQDGRRDVPRHPRPGHQARRPAAQHAHAALHAARQAGAQVARDAGDLRAARAPPRHEHGQVGA